MRRWFLSAVSWTCLACTPGFEPGYRVTDTRVLALRAEPPEAVPGEEVEVIPLIVNEGGPLDPASLSLEWWRCEGGAILDAEGAPACRSPRARIPLGREGSLRSPVPPALFAALPPAATDPPPAAAAFAPAIFGVWDVIGLSLVGGERVIDAFKRVVVYPPAPLGTLDERLSRLDVRLEAEGQLVSNTNPQLLGIEVREGEPDGAPAEGVKPGGTYWLRPLLDETTLESYWAIASDWSGASMEDPLSQYELSDEAFLAGLSRTRRCEVPTYSWYVTAGNLRSETTVDERVLRTWFGARGEQCQPLVGDAREPDVWYTAPPGEDRAIEGPIHVWVVLRDGRGGTDWAHAALPLRATPPP